MRITNEMFSDEFQYRLLEAHFLDVEEEPTEGKSFEQIDRLEKIEIDKKGKYLEAYVSRTICFSPKGPFEITVRFIVRRLFNKAADMKKISTDNLSEAEINEILAGTMGRTSAVISSITGFFTNGPVITPPFFISDEE